MVDPEGQLHTKCKVKGLALNYQMSQVVNFVMLHHALKSGRVKKLQAATKDPHKIMRLPNYDIVSKPLEKSYKNVYQKRVLLPDHNTVP